MKHLKDPITPINKFANTVRLLGIVLMLVAAVCFTSYQPSTDNFWDSFRVILVMLGLVGLTKTVVGDVLWRLLLKHSDVTHRRFYFYDEE